jgi:superfamily II DNA/RNA helicase
MELLQETDLKLSRVEIIVYDEADHLFENVSFANQLK